jgi:hypothetical protein
MTPTSNNHPRRTKSKKPPRSNRSSRPPLCSPASWKARTVSIRSSTSTCPSRN